MNDLNQAKKSVSIRVKKIVLLILMLAVATLAVEFVNSDNASGKIDLISFWLSARCFVEGMNPYACAGSPLAAKTAKSLSYALEMVNTPFNPPLLFPLIAPLALFSFERASAFWLVFSLAIFVWAVLLGERGSSTTVAEKMLKLLVYLSFFPAMVELFFGQISPLILAGFVLYLCCLQKAPAMSFRAGFALSVTLIKPHLLHLIYADLFLRAVKLREWKAVCGFAAGAAFLSVLTLFVQPQIFSYYLQHIGQAPLNMYHPTLSSWLQMLAGNFSFWLRCLPAFILWTLLFLRYVLRRNAPEQKSNYLVALLPWSLLTSPYGWVTDQVLLLTVIPVLLNLAGRFRAIICFILICCHLFALSGFHPSGMHYFVWYPFVVAVLFLIVQRMHRSAIQ